jgi:hypothetical protein
MPSPTSSPAAVTARIDTRFLSRLRQKLATSGTVIG